jgi:dihydroorotate dehydrogenase (fumarate)
MEMYSNSYSEALSYFPGSRQFAFGPDEYLEHIGRIRKAVAVPVIASLNGSSLGGWIDYARRISEAGAHALELNVYHVSTDPNQTGFEIEQQLVDVARAVKEAVSIPVAVKLSPFFASLPNLCCRLDDLGVEGIILFNRFYQPDINPESLECIPRIHLSDSSELALRLRWAAIIYPHLHGSIAISGGVHTARDAIKAVMSGAAGVQVVSALLKHGPEHLATILEGVRQWMQENEHNSIRLMQGSMSMTRCPSPSTFERANYMRVLQSWRSENRAGTL